MSYSGSQMQAVMAKISSDGLTISRTMPTMLSDHMSNIHWNTFCEEVEEATTTSTATTVNTPEPLVPLKKVDEDDVEVVFGTKDKKPREESASSNINGNEYRGKEMSDESNNTTYHKEGELILQINELTKRNQELEAKVTSLSDERERLIAIRSKDDEVAGSPSVSFEIAEKKEEALIIPTSTPGRASRKQQTNQELEAQVASLTIERDKLVTMLAKEKNKSKQRRDEAKERRKRFQDKLSKMSDKLKGDFDDEEDTDET